jgi:drug/metabolite transporter (DMT)-like permease
VTATSASTRTTPSSLQIWLPLVSLWLLWGSTYLGVAIVVEVLPPLLSTGLRLIAGCLLLGTGLVLFKGPGVLRITRVELAYSALMGVSLLGMGLGTVALAERFVPSGITALVVSGIPLWIVLLRLRSGDRPATLTLAGVGVGIAGLTFMLLPGGTVPRTGSDADVVFWSIAVLCGSLSWAYFSWRSTGYCLPKNSLVTSTYELLSGGLFTLGIGAITGERLDLQGMTTAAWSAWIWLAVASALGFAAFSWLLANVPLSLVSTYAYVNPAIAVLLGVLILGEALTRDVLIGLTVVLGGVILVIRGERRRS